MADRQDKRRRDSSVCLLPLGIKRRVVPFGDAPTFCPFQPLGPLERSSLWRVFLCLTSFPPPDGSSILRVFPINEVNSKYLICISLVFFSSSFYRYNKLSVACTAVWRLSEGQVLFVSRSTRVVQFRPWVIFCSFCFFFRRSCGHLLKRGLAPRIRRGSCNDTFQGGGMDRTEGSYEGMSGKAPPPPK